MAEPLSVSEKRFLKALAGAPVDRPPFWIMRQAGRYLPEYRAVRATTRDFVSFCLDSEKACAVTLQPIERFGMDAAILFSDILIVPHGLGQGVRFVEGEGPRLDPVTTETGIAALSMEGFHDRVGAVYETVRLLSKRLPGDVALIGFAGAPWTVATYMVAGQGTPEQKPARLWAYRDPDGFQALIDLITEATIDYLAAQVEAGAEALQIFDTWAGSLPETELTRWVFEPIARIRAALRARFPHVPVIGFAKGIGPALPQLAPRTGVEAVGIDSAVPLSFVRDEVQPGAVVQGNLDPLLVVAGGKAMHDRVETILKTLGPDRFVFNLGHGVVPETPPEHVAALSRQIREWRP
ncbi:uroporphyrinogen decarboxylase [Zavarzinia compransoris]|uniref:uroporphyrinogen decarboxylase n=1 Tax=Zavarzinia marina TaxID=2911065 RepID=UPI001F1B2606|nr:uroporphyrinogen decarboxylase [Zavarzinia marina]MCF4166827.1 uroporphyrinogen decarboxylase [Zavarzinia marina]